MKMEYPNDGVADEKEERGATLLNQASEYELGPLIHCGDDDVEEGKKKEEEEEKKAIIEEELSKDEVCVVAVEIKGNNRPEKSDDEDDGIDGDMQYVPTHYSLQEEVANNDWRAKVPTFVPVPLEVAQLKSLKLQFYFKIFFTVFAVVCLALLLTYAYISKRQTKFLALDKSAGNCQEVLIEFVTGDWYIDWDGVWSTSDAFDQTDTYIRVVMKAVPASDFGKAMKALAEEFEQKKLDLDIEDHSLTQNMLLAMTYKATWIGENGGKAQAWIETSADTLLQVSSITVGATGCPPGTFYFEDRTKEYAMGYRQAYPNFVYETDIENFDGYTKIAWSADAVATCTSNIFGFKMSEWLEQLIKFGELNNYPSEPSEHESFNIDWYSVVAAAAINDAQVSPYDFMDELDNDLYNIASTVFTPQLNATLADLVSEDAYYKFLDNGYQCSGYESYEWFRSLSGARNSSVYSEEFSNRDPWITCPSFQDGFLFGASDVDPSKEYNVQYFSDTSRKAGMQPLACTFIQEENVGWVCSIVIGGTHAYPMGIFHHLDKCNHCESNKEGLSYLTYNTQECVSPRQRREYYGGLLFKPNYFGPYTNHPYPPNEAWIASDTLDTATLTKFISYEVGYSSAVFTSCYNYYAACAVTDWYYHWFVAFNNFEQSQPLSIINEFGFINKYENWHCSTFWIDTASSHLKNLIKKPPIDLDETFLKCKPSASSAFIASLGESEGNVNIFLIVLSIVMTQGVIAWLHKYRPHYFHGNIVINQDQIIKSNIVNAANREYRRRSSFASSGRASSISNRASA